MRLKTALVVSGLLMGQAIAGADFASAQMTSAALEEATRQADAGNLDEARQLLSRWFSESSSEATRGQVAQGRFLRARLAPTAAAAQSDYRWLVVEGGDDFAPAARLRLAQLSLVRGELGAAAGALDRLRSDHPGHPAVVHSWLWTGHVAEAAGDEGRACQAWRSAGRLLDDAASSASSDAAGASGLAPPASLRSEIEALLASCAPAGGAPLYAIQFGAFRTRAPAQQLTSALAAAGVAARLVEAEDASGWYRVRTAGFSSRPPAERTARTLVGRGFEAVVVRVSPDD
ncbi:MAG: SPOR domain-containing protein [Gemmatimonadota bacterium]